MVIIITIIAYFGFLLAFSRVTSRRATNDTFYRADRRSPWYMVAFGMIGASISGVTFVSVPGMVIKSDMTYLQMCLGFIFGYAIVAFVLLPVYYRMNLTTIYSYLQTRLGRQAYKTLRSFCCRNSLGLPCVSTWSASFCNALCSTLWAFLSPWLCWLWWVWYGFIPAKEA